MNFSAYDRGSIEEVERLFTMTFSDSEGQTEGNLIGNLVRDLMTTTNDNDLYGFVASDNKHIIGGIFFSRLTFENEASAFLLSPVAIQTSYQKKGIGQKLINFGLNALKNAAVELVFTYGDPRYYAKVGFSPISENMAKAPLPLSYPDGWLGQSLDGSKIEPIAGNSQCVDAFNRPEIW